MNSLRFREAKPDDWPEIWPIFHAVVVTGDSYAYPPDTTEQDGETLWMQPGTGRSFTFVAEVDGRIVATAYLKPNMIGLGDHICNAGWMVSPQSGGRGVGRRFAEYVMERARELGFAGMQFNAVVVTNTRAVRLWESMGFEVVGTVPDAFRHSANGPTAVHIMYRAL
jgi:L-amino acid N-acyltransferase YncA